jgi:hypothetical protein
LLRFEFEGHAFGESSSLRTCVWGQFNSENTH